MPSEHPLGPDQIHLKAKTSNASIWVKVFLGIAKSALRETGGGNINILVSKLDFIEIFSVNGFSCITSENQLLSMLLLCRTEKIWRKRTLESKWWQIFWDVICGLVGRATTFVGDDVGSIATCGALEMWPWTFGSRTVWLVNKSARQPQFLVVYHEL